MSSHAVAQILAVSPEGALTAEPRLVRLTPVLETLLRLDKMLVGIAIGARPSRLSLGEEQSYLLIGRAYAALESNIASANAARLALERSIASAGLGSCVAKLESFLREGPTSHEGRQRLGLIFYRWAVDTNPPHYISGDDHLHEAFFAHLVCQALPNPPPPLRYADAVELLVDHVNPSPSRIEAAERALGMDSNTKLVRHRVQAMFEGYLSSRANLFADSAIPSTDLPGIRTHKEFLLTYYLMVAGLFSGATQYALLTVAIDLMVGYVQFLQDARLAEADGIVDDDEAMDVAFSFGTMLLPILPFGADAARSSGVGPVKLAGKLLSALDSAVLVAMLIAFAAGIKAALDDMVARRGRLEMARKAGFAAVEEVDTETTLLIPKALLRVAR
jgi:hypothetical protein